MISTGIVSCCSARFNWLVKPHLLTCPSSLHLSIIIIITRLKILSPTGALYVTTISRFKTKQIVLHPTQIQKYPLSSSVHQCSPH